MRYLVFACLSVFCLTLFSEIAHADIKYVKGYNRSDGTYVSGHYRDTSNDGNPYNNANALGYND